MVLTEMNPNMVAAARVVDPAAALVLSKRVLDVPLEEDRDQRAPSKKNCRRSTIAEESTIKAAIPATTPAANTATTSASALSTPPSLFLNSRKYVHAKTVGSSIAEAAITITATASAAALSTPPGLFLNSHKYVQAKVNGSSIAEAAITVATPAAPAAALSTPPSPFLNSRECTKATTIDSSIAEAVQQSSRGGTIGPNLA